MLHHDASEAAAPSHMMRDDKSPVLECAAAVMPCIHVLTLLLFRYTPGFYICVLHVNRLPAWGRELLGPFRY